MYIGITFDEFHRIKKSNVSYIENKYPFVDAKITRQGNVEILKAHNFTASKSGCVGCIYNKRHQWTEMFINNREEFERWALLDRQNSKYPKVTLSPNYTLESIKSRNSGQVSLLKIEDVEPNCDVSGSCFL